MAYNSKEKIKEQKKTRTHISNLLDVAQRGCVDLEDYQGGVRDVCEVSGP